VDIAVVVNLKARRGSEKVARTCRRHLPDARVLASQTLDETVGFARGLRDKPPSLLLSAGGDGTVVALMNALRGANAPDSTAIPGVHPQLMGGAIGLLPLGTGNGWAHVTGAPRWRTALEQLAELAERGGPLPVCRFDLLEVEGRVAHFAGTGWDAEMIDDFHAQKTGWGLLPDRARNGLAGYIQGVFTRTIPRHLREPQVEVEILNTGEDAMTLDDRGRPVRLPGGEHGAVLYRGPSSVCGAGTTQEWGFGFKAFPFANTVARRFNLRMYSGKALEATLKMRSLWSGKHPMEKMHTWLLTSCKARFSRAVPLQIGGDRVGHRDEVHYALAAERVDVLDWRAIS
jgi:Diacylglycerol kinase catalytic domain